MSNTSYEFDLKTFNDNLREMIKEDQVNNLELIMKSDQSKVSVTLESDKEYLEIYHGLHPSFDEAHLKKMLFCSTNSNQSINTSEVFWSRTQELQNKYNFMHLVSKNDSKRFTDVTYLETLLGRSILQMSTHFGFVCKLEKNLHKDFYVTIHNLFAKNLKKERISCYPEIEKNRVKKSHYWRFSDNWESVHLTCIWPSDKITELSKKFNVIINKDGDIVICRLKDCLGSKKKDDVIKPISHLLTFQNDFEEYYGNGLDSIYYSGVMPKVLRIRYDDKPTAAGDIKYIIFDVARTTFATVDMMDNPIILTHDFFNSSENDIQRLELMNEFDQHEDDIQKEFLYGLKNKKHTENKGFPGIIRSNDLQPKIQSSQRQYECFMINKLNMYLERTYNTNTIAVSANITTRDEYLIIGKRGKLTIDNNTYYCSANGQSEFRDKYVSFYRNSVYEDLPSMDFESEYRIDLNNEIQRESLAELGIVSFEKDWSYYGVSYLSINNTGTNLHDIKNRRMHFNVLAHNKTTDKFADIYKSQKRATENFENEHIRGIKLRIHQGRWSWFLFLLKSVSNFLIKHESYIYILYFIVSIVFLEGELLDTSSLPEQSSYYEKAQVVIDNFVNIGWKSIFDVLVFILFIRSTIKDFFSTRKVRSLCFTMDENIKNLRYINPDTKNLEPPKFNFKWNQLFDFFFKKCFFIKLYKIILRSNCRCNTINRASNKNSDFKFHAIFRVMYSLYFFNKVED